MKYFKDMDDTQMYMGVWSLLFTAFLFLVTAVSLFNYTENKMIHDLVANGEDPLEIACMYDTQGLEAACMIIAQTKATEAKQNVPK